MNSRSLFLSILAGCLLIGAVFFTYPLFTGSAQKDPGGKATQNDNLSKMREDQLASRFYDKALAAEPGLVLGKFSGASPVDAPNKPIGLIFKKGSEDVTVNITEYPSEEAAKLPFTIQVNADVRPFSGMGDEATKTYSAHGKSSGKFAGLALRKGRFYVAVFCSDEKLAERLAAQALETIGS